MNIDHTLFEFLRWAIPIYLITFVYIAVIRKSILQKRKIGKSPIYLPSDLSKLGILALYLKLSIVLEILYVIVFTTMPDFYNQFRPLNFLESNSMVIAGLVLGVVSLVIITVAQNQMKESWRIGIDQVTKTKLVKEGLFRYSRNPIYVGMIISMFAFFLVTPNMFTLFYLILGSVAIHLHILIEEEHLNQAHGLDFSSYCQKTRRYF